MPRKLPASPRITGVPAFPTCMPVNVRPSRPSAPAAPARREADKPAETREAAKGESAEKPTVAESGKPLPADEQPSPDEPVAEGELDPLLLFGLGGGQLPVEDAASELPRTLPRTS